MNNIIGDLSTNEILPCDWKTIDSMIKVIGVGGGGCNAVSYMYNQKVQGCNFVVCNTDSQVLRKSDVPIKIQLGKGLGAGTDPTKGRNAALESQEEIYDKVLNEDTQMLFITAGMGGGTGTGASPVIAKMAKDKGILTVAVVTLPFSHEGSESMAKAIDGIHELEKNVDSLLIINNEKLYKYFGDNLVQDAFPKADEVLATSIKGITEIIKKPGYINVDFEDVKTMMKNSGLALMGCGVGSGPNRLEEAVKAAMESPLLNDFDLSSAKNLLVNITAGNNEKGITVSDFTKINDLITSYTGDVSKFKRGLIWDDDPQIEDKVKITVIATGFRYDSLKDITDVSASNIISIAKDFVYENYPQGEITLPEANANISKIGFNTGENVRRFNFTDSNKPVLVTDYKQNFEELENIASIRRVVKNNNN